MDKYNVAVAVTIDDKPWLLSIGNLQRMLTFAPEDRRGFALAMAKPGHVTARGGIDLGRQRSWDEIEADVLAAVDAVQNPPARTPLTRDTILAWAAAEVERNPMFVDWSCEHTYPNNVRYVLASLLQAAAVSSISDHNSRDLRKELATLYWDGCQGYKAYGVDEALAEIMRDLVDPDNSDYEFDDLESMIEELHGETR